jgi:hypothetical protein
LRAFPAIAVSGDAACPSSSGAVRGPCGGSGIPAWPSWASTLSAGMLRSWGSVAGLVAASPETAAAAGLGSPSAACCEGGAGSGGSKRATNANSGAAAGAGPGPWSRSAAAAGASGGKGRSHANRPAVPAQPEGGPGSGAEPPAPETSWVLTASTSRAKAADVSPGLPHGSRPKPGVRRAVAAAGTGRQVGTAMPELCFFPLDAGCRSGAGVSSPPRSRQPSRNDRKPPPATAASAVPAPMAAPPPAIAV